MYLQFKKNLVLTLFSLDVLITNGWVIKKICHTNPVYQIICRYVFVIPSHTYTLKQNKKNIELRIVILY